MLADCSADSELNVVKQAFQYIKDNQANLQLLLNNNGSNILHESLKNEFSSRFALHPQIEIDDSIYGKMKTEIIVSAVAGMFEWWIQTADQYSVDEAVESYIQIRNDFFPGA